MAKTADKLLVVESPAKAKTISKYVGDEYNVVASVGHIRDLPKSNKNAIDIEGGYIPNYVIPPRKKEVVENIKGLAKNSSEILLATDPDREGEAIAWHLSELVDPEGKKTKRVVYHEITKEAVKEALKHPREIDRDLKEAQEARRVLDRLVGYDLSGLIWRKVRYGLSAGRVQSPALRILMEREREIRSFTPEDFWVISAKTKTEKEEEIIFTCSEEPGDEKEVEKIVKTAENGAWKIKEVKETKVSRSPKAPFITSTLQQAASSRLGFSPSRTMSVAQKLYEAGLITYMRTDSTSLSNQAMDQAKKYIEGKVEKSLYQKRVFKSKSKSAQEAHEAVRPTNILKQKAGTTEDQKRLYTLIWQRTVASQMIDAQILRTKIIAQVNGGETPDFQVNGSRVINQGWLLVDPASKGDDVLLPEVKEGDPLSLIEINTEQKQTQPPNRYSEAGLIKELEKRGIGRPSTYASIIKTLEDRGYVVKENKALFPTDTGDVVSSFLEDHFANYISDSFTSEMEDSLDDIAEGKKEYEETIDHFYKPLVKEIEEKKDIPKVTDLGKADKKYSCPKCGGDMIIKLGKAGKFLSCAKFPECDGALTIDGTEIAEDKPIGNHPETDEPIFVKVGRFGPYVQMGEKKKGKNKPKMASIPKDKNLDEVTLEDALKYLSLPRILGNHPETGKEVAANRGRFGPYIVHDGDFRSLKNDDVYEITLDRALEILKEPKKTRGRKKK